MASLWVQMKGQPERKLEGHMSGPQARRALQAHWEKWCKVGGQTATEGADGYIQLREGSAICGVVWIEWASPPSAPEPGQPHRQRKGIV